MATEKYVYLLFPLDGALQLLQFPGLCFEFRLFDPLTGAGLFPKMYEFYLVRVERSFVLHARDQAKKQFDQLSLLFQISVDF